MVSRKFWTCLILLNILVLGVAQRQHKAQRQRAGTQAPPTKASNANTAAAADPWARFMAAYRNLMMSMPMSMPIPMPMPPYGPWGWGWDDDGYEMFD